MDNGVDTVREDLDARPGYAYPVFFSLHEVPRDYPVSFVTI